jgi:hypothetical protein
MDLKGSENMIIYIHFIQEINYYFLVHRLERQKEKKFFLKFLLLHFYVAKRGKDSFAEPTLATEIRFKMNLERSSVSYFLGQ